jgi:hypothetical protein
MEISRVIDYSSEFPKISFGELSLRWYIMYYDGPLSGILDYKGERCYWHAQSGGDDYLDYDENGVVRLDDKGNEICLYYPIVYTVHKLSNEQIELENKKHALFEAYVGFNTNYFDDLTDENYGKMHPSSWHKIYYREANQFPEHPQALWSDETVIGWFTID